MAIAPQNEHWPDKCDVEEMSLARQCRLFTLLLIAALLSWLVPERKRAKPQGIAGRPVEHPTACHDHLRRLFNSSAMLWHGGSDSCSLNCPA